MTRPETLTAGLEARRSRPLCRRAAARQPATGPSLVLAILAICLLGQPALAQVPGAYPNPGYDPAGTSAAEVTLQPTESPFLLGTTTPYPGGLAPVSDTFFAAEETATPAFPAVFGSPTQDFFQPTYTPDPATFSGQPQGMPMGQASGVLVALPVTPLRLTDGPGTLDITVDGAPPFRSFELTLEFDPAAMVVTNVSAGAMLAAAGGTMQPLGPDLTLPGSLRYGVTLADTTTWPQGSGSLARVTLAPLVQSGAVSLRLASATLVDETGQRIDAATRDGIVEIPVSPPPAAQTEAVAAATALAAATPPAAAGTVSMDLVGDVTGRLASGGGVLLWLAFLALGSAVALAGWALGKRPEAGA